jgi:hypothetical protein
MLSRAEFRHLSSGDGQPQVLEPSAKALDHSGDLLVDVVCWDADEVVGIGRPHQGPVGDHALGGEWVIRAVVARDGDGCTR